MSVFDLEDLLGEVDADTPVGDDLEYDPAFIEMETLANSGGDQSMIEGADEAETHSTDWQGVRQKSLDLLARSKDLRVAVYLARSAIVCDGVAGFAEALRLLREFLERFWDQVHPLLDPGDDNDPTMRVNTLAMLCGKPETLDLLHLTPLVSSKKVGNFCLRDVQIATGEIVALADEGSVPTMALISAACQDCELDALKATATAIEESLEHSRAIDQSLTERVGSSRAPDMLPLKDTLVAMNKFVAEQLVKRGVSAGEQGAGGGAPTEASTASADGQAVSGEILSRADAMRMMDKISTYFMAHEPSSPIPLLMQRAKRLSSMDFLGILKDLAPSGLSQAQNIAGSGDAESGNNSGAE